MTAQTPSVYKTTAGEQAVMAFYESVLERWPTASERLDIPTRYGSTFVIASGDRRQPPLILLHGAGTNSAIWAGDVAEYSHHYRVYAVDLLGEVGKSAPSRPAWEGTAYAEWLEDVLKGLQIEKTTLIGISQGAWTALKFAVWQPQRIEKLVLITPGGILPDQMSFLFRAVLYSVTGQWGMSQMNRLLYADQPVPDGVGEVMALISKHFKSRIGVLPIFSDAELQRLTMPTLLLGGSKDALRDNVKIGARLRSLLPCLTVQIVPGGGHALLNTLPHVLRFLRGEGEQQPEAEGMAETA